MGPLKLSTLTKICFSIGNVIMVIMRKVKFADALSFKRGLSQVI